MTQTVTLILKDGERLTVEKSVANLFPTIRAFADEVFDSADTKDAGAEFTLTDLSRFDMEKAIEFAKAHANDKIETISETDDDGYVYRFCRETIMDLEPFDYSLNNHGSRMQNLRHVPLSNWDKEFFSCWAKDDDLAGAESFMKAVDFLDLEKGRIITGQFIARHMFRGTPDEVYARFNVTPPTPEQELEIRKNLGWVDKNDDDDDDNDDSDDADDDDSDDADDAEEEDSMNVTND